jgi:putative flippase GtrA
LFPKLLTFKETFRYFLVVACGFCVDFSIYAALVTIGESAYWANAAGFCVGVIVNVILIRSFVFPDSRFRLGNDVLLTFASNGAILGLGMGALWILVDKLHIDPYGAKLFINGLTFIFNYATRSLFFRKM